MHMVLNTMKVYFIEVYHIIWSNLDALVVITRLQFFLQVGLKCEEK